MPMKRTYSQYQGVSSAVARAPPRRIRSRTVSQSGTQSQRTLRGERFVLTRFRVDANLNVVFSPFKLIQSAGCFSINTTQAKAIGEALRITHVRLLGAPPASGAVSECAVEFKSAVHSNSLIKTNSSNNPNISPTVYTKPGRMTTEGDWQLADSTDDLLRIEAPTNSILEIGMVVRNHPNGSAGSTFSTPFSVTGDRIYYFAPNSGLSVIQ